MPAAEWSRLDKYVATAHANGQIVRFWATPDTPGAARDKLWQVGYQIPLRLVKARPGTLLLWVGGKEISGRSIKAIIWCTYDAFSPYFARGEFLGGHLRLSAIL